MEYDINATPSETQARLDTRQHVQSGFQSETGTPNDGLEGATGALRSNLPHKDPDTKSDSEAETVVLSEQVRDVDRKGHEVKAIKMEDSVSPPPASEMLLPVESNSNFAKISQVSRDMPHANQTWRPKSERRESDSGSVIPRMAQQTSLKRKRGDDEVKEGHEPAKILDTDSRLTPTGDSVPSTSSLPISDELSSRILMQLITNSSQARSLPGSRPLTPKFPSKLKQSEHLEQTRRNSASVFPKDHNPSEQKGKQGAHSRNSSRNRSAPPVAAMTSTESKAASVDPPAMPTAILQHNENANHVDDHSHRNTPSLDKDRGHALRQNRPEERPSDCKDREEERSLKQINVAYQAPHAQMGPSDYPQQESKPSRTASPMSPRPASRSNNRARSTQAQPEKRKQRPMPLNIDRRSRPSEEHQAMDSDDSGSVISHSAPRTAQSLPSSMTRVSMKKNRDRNGRTLLARACTQTLEEAERWIQQRPEDINVPDNAGNTPLQIASLAGLADIVDALLKAGSDVYCKNIDLDTPLIDAVENGHLEVVKLLLEAGVDPRQRNAKGQEPLELVDLDEEGGPEIKVALLDARRRQDVSRRQSEDHRQNNTARQTDTPNAISGFFRSGTSGANGMNSMSPIDGHAQSPPPFAASSALGSAVNPPSSALSSSANSRRGRSVRSQHTKDALLWVNPTPKRLHEEASRGNMEMVDHILKMRPEVDALSVLAAVKGGHADVLGLMIALASPDPDPEPLAPSAEHRLGYATPMLAAIGRGNLDIIRMLLDQVGFDPVRRMHKGLTYAELSRSRQGPNWQDESNMLQKAYDEHMTHDSGEQIGTIVGRRGNDRREASEGRNGTAGTKRSRKIRNQRQSSSSSNSDSPSSTPIKDLTDSRRVRRRGRAPPRSSESDSEEEESGDPQETSTLTGLTPAETIKTKRRLISGNDIKTDPDSSKSKSFSQRPGSSRTSSATRPGAKKSSSALDQQHQLSSDSDHRSVSSTRNVPHPHKRAGKANGTDRRRAISETAAENAHRRIDEIAKKRSRASLSPLPNEGSRYDNGDGSRKGIDESVQKKKKKLAVEASASSEVKSFRDKSVEKPPVSASASRIPSRSPSKSSTISSTKSNLQSGSSSTKPVIPRVSSPSSSSNVPHPTKKHRLESGLKTTQKTDHDPRRPSLAPIAFMGSISSPPVENFQDDHVLLHEDDPDDVVMTVEESKSFPQEVIAPSLVQSQLQTEFSNGEMVPSVEDTAGPDTVLDPRKRFTDSRHGSQMPKDKHNSSSLPAASLPDDSENKTTSSHKVLQPSQDQSQKPATSNETSSKFARKSPSEGNEMAVAEVEAVQKPRTNRMMETDASIGEHRLKVGAKERFGQEKLPTSQIGAKDIPQQISSNERLKGQEHVDSDFQRQDACGRQREQHNVEEEGSTHQLLEEERVSPPRRIGKEKHEEAIARHSATDENKEDEAQTHAETEQQIRETKESDQALEKTGLEEGQEQRTMGPEAKRISEEEEARRQAQAQYADALPNGLRHLFLIDAAKAREAEQISKWSTLRLLSSNDLKGSTTDREELATATARRDATSTKDDKSMEPGKDIDDDQNLWVANVQVAPLLACADLALTSYASSWSTCKATLPHVNALWRQLRNPLSVVDLHSPHLEWRDVVLADEESRPRFFALANHIFWIRLDDFFKVAAHTPHLREIRWSRRLMAPEPR